MDFIQIEIPSDLLDTDAIIDALSISAIKRGANPYEGENNKTIFPNITNTESSYAKLTYDAVAYIVSLGGEVLNYQSYIEVDLTANVPSYIRDYQDSDGNNLTWAEWLATGQSSTEIGGKTYISGYAHYSGFKASEKAEKHLTGTELTALRLNNYTVLNKSQFNDLMND